MRPDQAERIDAKPMREIPHALEILDKEISTQRELLQLLNDRLVLVLRKEKERVETAKSPPEQYYESTMAVQIQELYVRIKNNNAGMQMIANLLEL